MEFRRWVLETFSPVVMVVASPALEAAVQRHNGLNVTDVLRPSGYFRHLNGATSRLRKQTANDPCAINKVLNHCDLFARSLRALCVRKTTHSMPAH